MARLGARLVVMLGITCGVIAAFASSVTYATTPTPFATLRSPYGIAVGPGNNVFVTSDSDDLSTTWVSKYSPTGQLLGRTSIGGVTVGELGKLAWDQVGGKIWDISSNGMLRTIDPSTLAVQPVMNLKQDIDVTASASDIFDVNLGWAWNQSGSVLPALSSYGDIALYRSGVNNSRLDAFITARTVSYNVPWVLRLRWESGQFTSATAVVMSSAIYWVGVPRGITVTPSGTVITTLPRIGRLLSDFTDQVVSFPFDFTDVGGPLTVELESWDESSRGMASDSRGYTYITSQLNSSLCGVNAGGSVMVLSPARQFQACYSYSLLADGEDVAVRPSDWTVYSTIGDEEEVNPTFNHVLQWGPLAGTSLTVRRAGAGSGTVSSTPAGISCGNTCSSSYSSGTQVTLQASADSTSTFEGWSGGGCSGTGACVVTVNGDKTVTATFRRAIRRLTVFKDGNGGGTIHGLVMSGGGSGDPTVIDCGSLCTANLPDGATLFLQFTANPGSTFTGWTGGGCSGSAFCLVTMDDDKLVAATFSSGSITGYPRPKGATPTRVSLVPAYQQCTSPNTRHSGVLSYDSCSPPVQASSHATIGTPDANGGFAKSVGSAQYNVILGDPATPADEADVRLSLSLTDVRRKTTLADYTGQLQLVTTATFTDTYNGPALNLPATGTAVTFPATVPCAATADTTIGGACSLTTTFDTILPGVILEAKRSIGQLGKVNVFDGGADGLVSTAPNTLFATQGIFVP